jgi:hypothetical protein
MSLAAACGWTLLRSLLVVVAILPLCAACRRLLEPLTGHRGTWAWALLLVPFFVPELAVAYAYSNFSLSLIHYPVWNELLYAALIAMRLVPAGTVILRFSPPSPISIEAWHCRRLAARSEPGAFRRMQASLGFAIRGPWRASIPAFCLIFILAFQDFEIASLMGTIAWTVWLFDAQAGGLPLGDSLQYALLPVGCAAAVLLPGLWFVCQSRRLQSPAGATVKPLSRPWSAGLWIYLVLAAIVVCGVPAAMIGRGTIDGFSALLQNSAQARSMATEIVTAGLLGVIAAVGAMLIVSWCLGRTSGNTTTVGWTTGPSHNVGGTSNPSLPGQTPNQADRPHDGAGQRSILQGLRWERMGPVLAVLLSLPGLCGALVVSLTVLAVFQWPLLNVFYNSPLPIPVVVALLVYLMPRALLLQVLLLAARRREALYLGELLSRSADAGQRQQGRELSWQMRGRGQFWAAVLLAYWGYLDLTAADLLAPPGVVSAPVRLYNLMHYGRSSVLSAMTCATVLAPAIAIVVAGAVRRQVFRWGNV